MRLSSTFLRSSTNARFIESLDTKYKSSVDRVQESRKDSSDDEDEDALFAELEAEIENADSAVLRDRGVKEMQAQLRRFFSLRCLDPAIDWELYLRRRLDKVQTMQQTGYGQYAEITDEKEVIRTSASVDLPPPSMCSKGDSNTHSNEPRCVIHFFHRDFKRCEIMDRHLAVSLVLSESTGCKLVDRTKI